MKKATYGEAQKQHAINLRKISRFTYPEIEAATGIPAGYIRKLMYEENAKEVTAVTQIVTDAQTEVTETVTAVTAGVTLEKPAENATELPILKVTDEKTGAKKRLSKVRFSRMDAVYYSVIVTGCIGFCNAVGLWGLIIAVPYLLVSVECLENAKDVRFVVMSGRWQGGVIAMELLASVFNHSLFNAIFWRHIDALPVHIVRQGNLVLVGGEAPFYASFVISAILFCFAFFAVDTVILKAKMKTQ